MKYLKFGYHISKPFMNTTFKFFYFKIGPFVVSLSNPSNYRKGKREWKLQLKKGERTYVQ